MSSPNLKRIAFLLGAGASLEAGMPKTEDITKRVLSGEGMNHDNSAQILALLEWIKNKIDYYYSEKVPINYEDFNYIVSQIHETLVGQYDNPALEPLIKEIIGQSHLLCVEEGYEPLNALTRLSSETAEYIKNTVCKLIGEGLCCLHPQDPLKYLTIIKDAYKDNTVSINGVFTLNHDPVLEQFFKNNNIQFNDGFIDKELETGVQIWTPKLFRENDSKIRFCKLHGSWNWWFVPWSDNSIVKLIPTEDDTLPHKWEFVKERILLIGTLNKMLEYTRGIFLDLFGQFWQSLCKTQYLIVSGYSFGDKGIDNVIIAWIYSSPECNKMVVIDPVEEKKFKGNIRGAILKNWDELKEREQLIYIKNKFSQKEVSWEKIKSKLL